MAANINYQSKGNNSTGIKSVKVKYFHWIDYVVSWVIWERMSLGDFSGLI